MTGIYCIENTANGKRYIGQARHIERRWRQHRVSLENGKHCNDHLQRAWKKYGENAFSFYVLELCDLESLSDRERFYIAKFDTLRNGYNMTEGGDGTRGYEHTEDYKRHMSELYAGRTFSQDTLRKMSEVKRGVTPEMTQARLDGYKIVSQKLKGKPFSEEHKAKLSAAKKGCTPWNKCKKLLPQTSPLYGKHHTEDTKRKIGDANRGKCRTKKQREAMSKRVVCIETGTVYPSITSAAEAVGVTIHAISNALRGKCKTCRNLHWRYKEGGGES